MSQVNYTELIDSFMSAIKEARDVSAPYKGLTSDCLPDELFDFEDEEHKKYVFLLSQARKNAYRFLIEAIRLLISVYNVNQLKVFDDAPIMAVFDNGEKKLYYFKEFGFLKGTDNINAIIKAEQTGANDIIYVSIVEERETSYSLDQRLDYKDISIKEFICRYFGTEEYNCFAQAHNLLISEARKYLGYSVIKTLTPHALYGFKRFILSYIRSGEFENIIAEGNSYYDIGDAPACIIRNNFFKKERYKALIGHSLFAESFITAEWMFCSLKEANSVDLTIIALGFFKALEQMLFDFIKLHSGEDLKIRRVAFLKNKPPKIYLNESSINNGWINTMMDSLIEFFEDYPELFEIDFKKDVQNKILKSLYAVKNLRNGYFHKDNISDWGMVEKARKSTYLAMYYLLGTLNFRENDNDEFSIPASQKSNYIKLCEYMNYHSSAIYYIGFPDIEYAASRKKDSKIEFDKFGQPSFSGIYLNKLVNIPLGNFIFTVKQLMDKKKNRKSHPSEIVQLDMQNPYLVIYEGTIEPVAEGMLFSGPVRKIFENGSFLIEDCD